MEALKLVRPSLDELKAAIGALAAPKAAERLACERFPAGLPRGSVVEVLGHGKTEFMAHFLAAHPNLRVAWVEASLSVYPPALVQRKVNLSSVLFIECGESEATWVATQVLQSQLFDVVCFHDLTFEEKFLRKMQLLSEKSETLTALLQDESNNSWVPSLVLEVEGSELRTRRSRVPGLA